MSPDKKGPTCPNCGALMAPRRSVPLVEGHFELATFECRPCGVVVTEVENKQNTAELG
jgi:transcription elongation factor Elf1